MLTRSSVSCSGEVLIAKASFPKVFQPLSVSCWSTFAAKPIVVIQSLKGAVLSKVAELMASNGLYTRCSEP